MSYKSKKRSKKIKHLINKEGKERDQAIAMAMNMIKKNGGKVPKYNIGGVLQSVLPTLDFAVPGLGTGLSVATGIAEQLFAKEPGKRINTDVNPYAGGGMLKKYKAPSHAKGGMTIDAHGNPAPRNKAVAEIELEENMLKLPGGGGYVFSDRLGTAKEAEKISKIKGDDPISLNGRKVGFNRLMKKNEIMKMQNGGPLDPLDPLPTIEPNPRSISSPVLPDLTNMPRINAGTLPTVGVAGKPATVSFNRNIIPPTQMTPRNEAGITLGVTKQLPTINTQLNTRLNNPLLPGFVTNNIPGPIQNENDNINTTAPGNDNNQGVNAGGLLKAAAYIGRGIDAFRPAEKEQLQLADFSRGNELAQSTGASFQSMANRVLGEANKAREVARTSSRNFGQFMNRNRAISASTGRNLSDVAFKERTYNDQLRLNRAARQDRISMSNQAERIRQQVAQSQNEARRQDLIQNFMSDINNLGTEVQRQELLKDVITDSNKNTRRQFMLDLVVANMNSPNFEIASPKEFMKLIDSEEYDKALKLVKFRD